MATQIMILLYVYIISSVWMVVTSFMHQTSMTSRWTSHHHQPYTNYFSTQLYASKRRGGAMARRKKSSIQKEDSHNKTKGFDQSIEQSTTTEPSKSDNIYSMPPLYDLAFGYRNYEEEVDFLLHVHDKYSSISNKDDLRVLELAAGPARHSLSALSEHTPSEVHSVVALDRSQDMVDYGYENADYELGSPGGRRDDFTYVNGDMRYIGDYIKTDATTMFDTAWLLLGSMQHLLTNDDIIACFSSLYNSIKSGGTVVIELPHPRETFSMGECTRNGWQVPLEDGDEKEYGELNIVWGEENDEFDPVSQIRHFTVGLELTVNNVDDIPKDEDTSSLFLQMSKEGKTSVKEIVPMRLYTLQEIDALARCAGFELVAKYGALAEDVSIEDEDEAFRMVCVLRRQN